MLLTLLIFLPLAFAGLALLFPEKFSRSIALTGSVLTFALSVALLTRFDVTTADLQFAQIAPWIQDFGVQYFVAIDGISLWLVMLTTFLMPLTIIASRTSIQSRIKGFHIHLLVLETAMLGTFLAMDAILFYVFFEASLIPMYFLIGIWGGQRRLYATMKFFIYTMAGSVLMLVAIIALMFMAEQQTGQITSNLVELYKLRIPFVGNEFLNPQTLMFFAFSLAFAIKVPMFPVHTWLPDAHVEAPTPGSVILAAVMLKMGTYGFFRFVIPLFPEASQQYAWVFLMFGAIGIVYGALVAMVQPDMKKLVAYSSVSHMGYVVLGIFAMNLQGLTGSLYQMLNHGISTGALFLLVGMIYERTHSREISKYGGLAPLMPRFTVLFIIVTMSSIAVPLTNGFIGEFLILMGTFFRNPVYGTIAVFGVVLGACYMLWMVKKVFFGQTGELTSEQAIKDHPLCDLGLRETLVMAPLIVLIFWMGIFPQHFLNYSKASLEKISHIEKKYELSVKK